MLTANNITKSFGIHTVLDNISFSLSAGERAALIGPNGCGKTTLVRILAGLEKPDKGSVTHTRPGLRIGYLAQGFEFNPEQSIETSLYLPVNRDTSIMPGELLEAEIAMLAARITQNPNQPGLLARYDSALAQLSSLDSRPESILGPLGLADFPLETPVGHLSGGQKTRLMLARLLINAPSLLLLDEPTNHLDIGMLEWLENWISRFKGAILMVSHDRAFLDNTAHTILELDPVTKGIKNYPGNYSEYVAQKLTENEHQSQVFSDQQEKIEQLRAAAMHIRGLTVMKKGGKSDSGDKFAKGFFGNRATRNTAGRARNIEARIEKLLGDDRIEKPRAGWQMKLDFIAPDHRSRDVLITQNLSVGYPGSQALLTGLNINIHAGQRIALTGPNGAGKTTLLRTIASQIEPINGSIILGSNVRLGYMSQEQELLDPALSPLQSIQQFGTFNETEARHFLHFFLFSGDDPLRPVDELSFGERARLQLAILVAQGSTFLLLDEPANHLDIPSRARFEQALAKFNGTALAVVHDRYFIEKFATDTWSIENGQIIIW